MLKYDLRYIRGRNFIECESPQEGLRAAAKFLDKHPDFTFAGIDTHFIVDGEYWETTLFYEATNWND